MLRTSKIVGLVSIFFSIFFCGTLIGWHNLIPTKIDWLLQVGGGDSIQHFIGWEFFRHDAWHFPLGKITLWGHPVGSSVVYTDSIPLFAIFFKLFSSVLPQHFQYFGLWYLLCYGLQAFFGWKLSQTISRNPFIQLAVTLLFIFSPIMLNRIGGHQSLVAQWTLLAGIYLYVKEYRSRDPYLWFALLGITLFIHAYMVLMLLGIWLAYLMHHRQQHLAPVEIWKYIATMLVWLSLLAWVGGYFVVSVFHGVEAGGYASYAMNLLAPINATDWSNFLPSLPSVSDTQRFEGFNYFGLGSLILTAVAFCELIYHPVSATTWRYWQPLIIICLLLTLYALSNEITFGSHILFTYPLVYKKIADTFRSCGRFFWPVYYVIIFLSARMVAYRYKPMVALIILMSVVGLQIADLSPKLKQIYHAFRDFPIFVPLQGELWQTAPQQYKKLFFVPQVGASVEQTKHYLFYAASHGMAVNGGYFARAESYQLNDFGKKLLQQVRVGQLNADTLYVIDRQLFSQLKPPRPSQNKIFMTDQHIIIAPQLKNSAAEKIAYGR